MSNEIIIIIIGLFAGVLSGTLGIGGGIVIIPALIYFLKMTQHEAQGTTLALMLPPTTLLSVYAYYKAEYIDIKVSIILFVGFFVGSYFGGKFATMVPALVLRKCFAIFMICIAINMLLSKK